jgi:hypothetical protein
MMLVNNKNEVQPMSKSAELALAREVQKLRDKDPRFDEKVAYWNGLYKLYPKDPSKITELMVAKFGA